MAGYREVLSNPDRRFAISIVYWLPEIDKKAQKIEYSAVI